MVIAIDDILQTLDLGLTHGTLDRVVNLPKLVALSTTDQMSTRKEQNLSQSIKTQNAKKVFFVSPL